MFEEILANFPIPFRGIGKSAAASLLPPPAAKAKLPHTYIVCVGWVALIFYVNIYLYLHENRHDREGIGSHFL